MSIGVYDTGDLVTEDVRSRMRPLSLEKQQVAVAAPCCDWPNQYLSALRSGDGNGFDAHREPNFMHDGSTYRRYPISSAAGATLPARSVPHETEQSPRDAVTPGGSSVARRRVGRGGPASVRPRSLDASVAGFCR